MVFLLVEACRTCCWKAGDLIIATLLRQGGVRSEKLVVLQIVENLCFWWCWRDPKLEGGERRKKGKWREMKRKNKAMKNKLKEPASRNKAPTGEKNILGGSFCLKYINH